MLVEFGGTVRSTGLIDTGAEINIIILSLTRRARLPIQDESKFINIISQTSHSREFYRVIEEVLIKIGLTVNTMPIWVVEEVNNEFIFKIPYIHVSRMTQKADSDNLTVLIFLNNNKTIVRFLNTLTQDARNQVVEDVFSLN